MLTLALAGLAAWSALYGRRRRLPAPAAPTALPTPHEQSAQQTYVRIALTDQPGMESTRVDAVRALGEVGDRAARPPLLALAEPDATFSTRRIRAAAREALTAIDRRHPAEPGRLSLTTGPSVICLKLALPSL